MNFHLIPLIKFVISNPSESKNSYQFLSLIEVLGGGDLERGDEAGASLAPLLLLSSLLVALWCWRRHIFGAIKLKVG